MQKIKKVGVLSMAKVFLMVYAVFGLIFGVMFSLFAITGISRVGGGMGPGLMFGVGAIIIIPIVYGVLGFISGAIFGAIYNIAAKYMGGIEMEVEVMSAQSSYTSPAPSTATHS